jgi:hypothetical protein
MLRHELAEMTAAERCLRGTSLARQEGPREVVLVNVGQAGRKAAEGLGCGGRGSLERDVAGLRQQLRAAAQAEPH